MLDAAAPDLCYPRESTPEFSFSEQFQLWASGFAGCDGGDPGTPEKKSIWVCAIEHGGGHTLDSLAESIKEATDSPFKGFKDNLPNTVYPFNRQVSKMLTGLAGRPVSDYKSFVAETNPFCEGSAGYLKLNLFPVAFRNINHAHWVSEFAAATGFDTKQEYLDWCKQNRLPKFRELAAVAKPKLILCVGKTFLQDFAIAFHDKSAEFNHEQIADRDLYWARNEEGTLIVNVPFLLNRWGLVKHTSIASFTARIRELMMESTLDDFSPKN